MTSTIDMMETSLVISTPGGSRKRKSPTTESGATGPLDSGEPGTSCKEESELPGTPSQKIRSKRKHLLGTLNVNTLRQTGKLKQLTTVLEERKISILALQETRFLDENTMESDGYRIYKGKPGYTISKGRLPLLGTAFVVKKSIMDSITNFSSPSERISFLTFRSGNKSYTIINAHAPINQDNKRNKEKVEDFWEAIANETSKIPLGNVKVLVGDFNAQIGKERKYKMIVGEYPAHNRTNTNGDRLINFCRQFNLTLMSTHFKALPRKKKTWISPNAMLGEFQIDHVAITTRNRREILNVKVRKSLKIDSDHYLSEIKVKFQPNRRQIRGQRKPRIDTEILKRNKNRYQENLSKLEMNNWEEIRESLTKAAENIGQRERKRKHRWWNKHCDDAVDARLEAWKRWSSNPTKENWNVFSLQRKTTAKIIRGEKRHYDKDRLEIIEEDFKRNNTREFYRTFKEELQQYQPPSLCFKRKDGTLALSNKENCHLLADYFETLLNCKEPPETLKFEKPTTLNPQSTPPSLIEIKNIIQGLKNNKAPGEDGIVAEMWKIGGDKAAENLHRLICDIWENEQIPRDWKGALIHPLHKKGDRTDPNNYRGISLLPVSYKVLSKVLLNIVEEQVDHHIGDYQGGFRKGRSCVEQIFSLKSILRVRALRGKNTVVVFVDFKKAYDSIDRQTLYNVLEEFGIDGKTRAIIKQTLSETISKVKFQGEISEAFEIKTGVRQGDGLSPILFNVVLEKIVRTWRTALTEDGIDGICLGPKRQGVKVDCLAFADDMALLAEGKGEARIMLEKLHEVAEKTGLRVSYEKTEYIEYKHDKEKHLETRYGDIKRADKFKYLGEWIQPNGLDKEANKGRARKMELAYRLVQYRYNKRSISYRAKIRHYTTVVRPEGLYSSECLILNKKGEIEELGKKERKILRKILGPEKRNDGTWRKRRNEDLYRQAEKITDTMRKRRLKFYGHLMRMEENRITKRIFNYITKLKATTMWVGETRKDMEEVGVHPKDIWNRDVFRAKIDNFKGFKERPSRTTKNTWSEERRRNHSERMKKFWVKKKELTSKSIVSRGPQ